MYNFYLASVIVPLVMGGSLKLDFKVNNGNIQKFMKRDNYFNMPLLATDNVGFYFTELGFGSENEKIIVLIDTGSADLWITADKAQCYKRAETEDISSGSSQTSDWAVADSSVCKYFGSFDWEQSSSFNRNSTDFDIIYADGTFASGFWGYDTVSIGSTTVDNVIFGVANQSSDVMGTLGLGMPGVELLVLRGQKGYVNFPQKLKYQGIIDRQIYSLYLNKAEAQSGTVLFGAIDHEKYKGELVTVPIVTNFSLFKNQVVINMDSFNVSSNKKNGPIPETQLLSNMAILLDSGTTISGFLRKTLTKLAESLGGGYLRSNYYVDCDVVLKSSLMMTIGNSTIQMPMSNFVYNYYGLCYLSFSELDSEEESSYIIVGQDFLRHLYVVYDFDGLEISVAEAFYSKKENIEVVDSDGKFNRTSKHKSGTNSMYLVSIPLLVISLFLSLSTII